MHIPGQFLNLPKELLVNIQTKESYKLISKLKSAKTWSSGISIQIFCFSQIINYFDLLPLPLNSYNLNLDSKSI